MLNLAVPITLPKPGSEASQMSPTEFVVSSPTRDAVKRKASFPEVTESQAKRFCLEPPSNSEDSTIEEYQKRIERDTFTMLVPFENVWKRTQEKVNILEESISKQSERISEHSEQIKALQD
jgi:hypothetical protein